MTGLLLAVAAVALLRSALGDDGPRRVWPAPARVLPPPIPRPVAGVVAHRAPGRHRQRRHPRPRRRPARPVRVLIPAIGVRAAIVGLHLNPDRTLQTPKNYAQAGWWADGPRPGAPGPAVIVGHVDSPSGPAVFYALRTLRRGDGIRVVGADGRTQHFVVQRLARFSKSRFPTKEVYGPTRAPRLRLITCGGSFDTATGHYRDNTVVFARPARTA